MFHAARSGKQHLALECLENRHLLSADFGAVDFHETDQTPVTAIIISPSTTQADVQVDSKGQFTGRNADQGPQDLKNRLGAFESDDLQGDDVEQEEFENERKQELDISQGTIQFAQISQGKPVFVNALGPFIAQGLFKSTPAQQVVIVYIQEDVEFGEMDEIEVDDVSLGETHEVRVVVQSKATSLNIVGASSQNVTINAGGVAVPAETKLMQKAETVATEQYDTTSNIESDHVNPPPSTSPVDVATTNQSLAAPSSLESQRALANPEYDLDFDTPLGEGTDPAAAYAPANISVEDAIRDESSDANASLQDLVAGVTAKVVPAARELISAGLSGNYEAIDLAMTQLLQDLDSVRTDATLLMDESTLRGLASTAVVGVVAAEIVRRRMREKERLHQATIEEHLAIWMYPECSGVSSRPNS